MATQLDVPELAAFSRTEPSVREAPSDPVVLATRLPRTWYVRCKPALEFTLALILLVLAAPVMAVLALVVKLTSRGPAFYAQTRVGRGGRLFTLYKLRSMANDCENVATLCRKRILAMAMLLMDTPASSSVNDDSLRRSKEIPSTTINVAAAPTNAASQTDVQPRQIARTAPSAEPLETPSVYGSASESRRRAWNSTPVSASVPPAIIASSRCSTETYSSLRLFASSSAFVSRRARPGESVTCAWSGFEPL